jgi:ribosomal protein S18 acetylase RimI-like enzyme
MHRVELRRLERSDEGSLEALLLEAPEVNLFLLGHLRVHPIDRSVWWGAVGREGVEGACLCVPERLVVPYFPDPALAEGVAARCPPSGPGTLLVGPRAASDAIWRGWGSPKARIWYDQRLYVARRPPSPLAESPLELGLRRARVEETELIALQSGRMEEEDLGRNTWTLQREAQLRASRDRILSGRTWVIERAGRIVFQVHVGTVTREGCQLGGTYVPPELRGQGWAVRGMMALTAHLLERVDMVSLHVNEANAPAVRCYERAGFQRAAAYRLATE